MSLKTYRIKGSIWYSKKKLEQKMLDNGRNRAQGKDQRDAAFQNVQ